MSNSETLKKLFENKKILFVMITAVFIGIILLSVSGFETDSEKSSDYTEKQTTDKTFEYDNIKDEIEDVLSSIEGLGKTKVLIIYNEQEASKNNDTFTYDGMGNTQKSKQNGSDISGIILVAEGGDNIDLTRKTAEALSEVIGIPMHKVKIFKMKYEER